MAKKDYKLTPSGVAELKEELSELKDRRLQVAEKLKNARELGDLSENAEYHAAREEQIQLENRLSEVEQILSHVEIIKEPVNSNEVELGNTVILDNGSSRELTIVGSVEADPKQNKISDESPLGRAILGRKVGDEVEISTPSGKTVYVIKKIK
ncbi:MAG TPA: transcription elongation factor GreA [Candidatus Saccharimonadales bacterium]